MYSEQARELRRCKATCKNGQPCRAWARWGTDLCAVHTFQKRGPARGYTPHQNTRAKCTCPAYAWPHRPGGGLCRWPDAPAQRSQTPAGTPALWRRGKARKILVFAVGARPVR